jgi:predicted component of type VI protein secretion system
MEKEMPVARCPCSQKTAVVQHAVLAVKRLLLLLSYSRDAVRTVLHTTKIEMMSSTRRPHDLFHHSRLSLNISSNNAEKLVGDFVQTSESRG